MLQKISLYTSSSLLRIVIFFGVSIVCFSLIATNPRHLKNIIKDTGIYDNFTAAVVADTISIQSETSSTLPVEDIGIQEIIKNGFPSSSLQKNTEHVIDGAYSWLSGEINEPEFSVDFTKERQTVANDIATHAFTRLNTLPTCFAVPETFDPFTAGCKPPFTDSSEQQAELSKSIAGPDGILPQASFTHEDLPKDINGNSIYKRYSFAPTVYSWLRFSILIVTILCILSAIGIVLFSPTKREGFIRLGLTIVTSGGALILTPILFSFVIPNISKGVEFTTQDTSQAQQLIDNVINSITNEFYTLLINVALQFIVLGTIILLIEKFTRPTSKYATIRKRSGVVSGYAKKPSSTKSKRYKSSNLPVQSSEESKRHRPKRTKNKKYRRIPKKEI